MFGFIVGVLLFILFVYLIVRVLKDEIGPYLQERKMNDILNTLLTIGSIVLVFYLITKLGVWYEDRQKKNKK